MIFSCIYGREILNHPVERQHVQKAFTTSLVPLKSVRPNAIIESGCRRETSEALLSLR